MVASGSLSLDVSICTSPPTAYLLPSGAACVLVARTTFGVGTGGGHVGLFVLTHFAITILELVDLGFFLVRQFRLGVQPLRLLSLIPSCRTNRGSGGAFLGAQLGRLSGCRAGADTCRLFNTG